MSNPTIENNFMYHEPSPDQVETYRVLRDAAKVLAYGFDLHCPAGREKSLAFTKLEESVMWANAAIARSPAKP